MAVACLQPVNLVGKAGPLRGLSAGKGMDKGDQYG